MPIASATEKGETVLMSAPTLEVDTSRFERSLRRMMAVSKRTGAEIINKALKDVAFRAASFTPKTTFGKIRGELNNDLITKMALKWLREKGVPFNKNDVKDAKARIFKARMRSIGALRAGWIPAIQKFGGNYRGAKKIEGGSASDGTAVKATPARISGLIRNAIVTSSNKGTTHAAQIPALRRGLLKGIAYVTRDRNREAQRRMLRALQRARV